MDRPTTSRSSTSHAHADSPPLLRHVIREALASLRRDWRSIAMITIVSAATVALVSGAAPPEPDSAREWIITAVLSVVSMLVASIASIAVIVIAARRLPITSRPISRQLVGASCALALLSGLASALGLFALLVGMLVVVTYTLVAPSILVAENVGPISAIKSSVRLTRRAPWRTCAIAMILLTLSLLPGLVLLVDTTRITYAITAFLTALVIPIYALASLHTYVSLDARKERAAPKRRWLANAALALAAGLLIAGVFVAHSAFQRHRDFEAYASSIQPLASTMYVQDLSVQKASEREPLTSIERKEMQRTAEAIADTWRQLEQVTPGNSLTDTHALWLHAARALHTRAEQLADNETAPSADDKAPVVITEIIDPAGPIADASLATLSAEATSLSNATKIRREWAEYFLTTVEQDRLIIDEGVDCSSHLHREYAALGYKCGWTNQLAKR